MTRLEGAVDGDLNPPDSGERCGLTTGAPLMVVFRLLTSSMTSSKHTSVICKSLLSNIRRADDSEGFDR